MTNIVDGLLYTTDDEWLKVDGNEAAVGITDYAQNALSDIVFVELPDEGDSFDEGETFGTVESVKAVADLNMPVTGTITATNDDLEDAPELLNDAPYDSWIVKITIEDASQLDGLMDAAKYAEYCAGR